MTPAIHAASWPGAAIASAIEALATATGHNPDGVSIPQRRSTTGAWLEAAGMAIGADLEETQVRYHELDTFLDHGGPALVRLESSGDQRLLLLLGRRRGRLRVLGPDRQPQLLDHTELHEAITSHLESHHAEQLDTTLDAADITARRRRRCRKALLAEMLGPKPVCTSWIIRPRPGSDFRKQLASSGHVLQTAILLACHVAQTCLFLAAWWLVGRGALSGNLDPSWLGAWALMLVSLVPLRMATVALQGRIVLGVGALLKRRLLTGILKLDLEAVKTQGAGMLLGRVIESNALESLLLGGGYRTLLSAVEIVATLWVLGHGAGGPWHSLLYLGWTAAVTVLGWRYWQRLDGWTTIRLALTHELAERLIGHRTRLAQQSPESWHLGEDEHLDAYQASSKAMDRLAALITNAGLGWRLIGFAALTGVFISGNASVTSLAIALGGLLLGAQALTSFTSGLTSLAIASIAWKRVSEMYHSAAFEDAPGTLLPVEVSSDDEETPVLSLHDVSFCYPGRDRKAVDNISLDIRRGERLILLGPSGGGKSTLAALLSSLRRPDSGLALCQGLDLPTLGAARWRQTVVAAPQFNDNHVLTETLAFNLLMGRQWPATAAELEEAETVCRELGLGELLDRMPSGMMQMVGDTGWQLSHGEKSRLFIARALLHHADLIILDESFGALDPVNLKRAVDCARRRSSALAVIAHP